VNQAGAGALAVPTPQWHMHHADTSCHAITAQCMGAALVALYTHQEPAIASDTAASQTGLVCQEPQQGQHQPGRLP
jgi:hypothetical protein